MTSSGWQTNAPVDSVTLDRPSGEEDRVTCLGATPATPVVLIADQPLIGGGTVSYFEVTLLEGSSIIVGLLGQVRNNDGGGAPGRRPHSLGLFSNGDFVSTVVGSECSLPFSAPFGMLDTVGIGCMMISPSDVRAFATHNGRDLGTILEAKLSRCPLYPAICFEDTGCIVTVRRHRPFLFELPPGMLETSPSATVLPPPPPPVYLPTSSSSSSPFPPAPSPPNPSSPNQAASPYQTSAGVPPQNVQGWLASHQANFSGTTVGKKITRMFTSSASKSSRLEADLLEAQEHIDVLANVLTEQDELQQHDLLKELTVSCRRLLVRHTNLVREATDDESLDRILAMNDRIIELLASADRILERAGGAPPKTVAPSGVETVFGTNNLVARGSADTVSEMLFMLRSGTSRSQKNAVQCLARLVRERTHNEMVVINGGIHAFVALSKSDQADDELRKLAARALAELASWVRLSTTDDDSATTRGVFRADLGDVMKTMELIVDEDPLLVSQAVSNVVLLLTSARPACNPTLNELGAALLIRILATDMDQVTLVMTQDTIALTRVGSSSNNLAPAHKRSSSWTPQTSLFASGSGEDAGKRKRSEYIREASRVAAFGLSLLIRRCDSARTVVVNNSTFFPIMEKMLLINDEELMLYALCSIKGLLYAAQQDDGFSQGFITARVLQSSAALQHLLRVTRRSFRGSARQHLVAAIVALVEHKSVLSLLLEAVTFADVLGALFSLLEQVLEEAISQDDTERSKMVMDESSFFNAHFRQQQNELNVREKKTRTKLSEFRLNGMDLMRKHSSGADTMRKHSSGNVLKDTHVFPQTEPIPSVLWELSCLSKGILRVVSAGATAWTFLPVEYFEAIVALSQLNAVHEELPAEVINEDGLYEVMFNEMLRNAADILMLMTEKFKSPDASLVASGLLTLTRSPDATVREKALKTIALAANHTGDLAPELIRQNCAIVFCEDKQLNKETVASTITGMSKHVFFPPAPLETTWASFHGFGPNELVIRFLLESIEKFDAQPECAAEACHALCLICSGKSALSVHYRCSIMKRVFFPLSHMSTRCTSIEGRKAAEELFKVCGFSQGALQVVANDGLAIKEWASIKVDLEVAHVLLDMIVAHLCESAWREEHVKVGTAPFFDERVDGLRIKLIQSHQHQQSSSPPLSRVSSHHSPASSVSTSASESPMNVSQKFMSTVSDLKQNPPSKWLEVMANGLGHAETFEKLAREVSLSDSKTTKIASTILRAFSSGGSLSNKPFVDYHLACIEAKQMLDSDSTTAGDDTVLVFPGVDHALPITLRDLATRVFWGMGSVQKYLSLTPVGFLIDDDDQVRPKRSASVTMELSPPFKVIRLASNVNYWTEKLIQRIIAEQGASARGGSVRWGLVLPGTALGDSEDDKNRLTDILFSCPSIISLSFTGRASNQQHQSETSPTGHGVLEPLSRLASTMSTTSSQGSADSSAGGAETLSPPGGPRSISTTTTSLTKTSSSVQLKAREQEEKLAQFMVNIPSSVTWLNFDRNCTSAEGLRLIAAFLGVRSDLIGCSVTNSGYSIDELQDFLRFLSRSAANNTLRYVDLSGNTNLGDLGCADVVRSFAGTNLVALDLSGIKLNNGGQATVDALLGVNSTTSSISRDVRGEARIQSGGLLASTALRYLALARCALSSESASRLLYALSKRAGAAGKSSESLHVLDLDKNNLKNLRQPLVSFLAFDCSVREFGFAENEIIPFISDVARALASNKTLQVFRHSIGTNFTHGGTSVSAFSSSAVPDTRYFVKQLETVMRRNRLDWMNARLASQNPAPPMMPPSPRDLTLLEESAEEEQNQRRVDKPFLHMLFCSPLVWRDESGKLQPADALDCDAEKQTLITSFEEARARNGSIPMDVFFDFGCTTDTLISVLTRKPTSLHLSTHGEETYIAMEDGKGGMHALKIEQLVEICRAAQVSQFLKLVFVSACNSLSIANAFHASGVKSVVAVDSKISDKAAQVFTRAFYLSIALGDPISSAFNLGREAVRSSPLLNEQSQSSGKNFVLVGEGKESVFPKPKKTFGGRPLPSKLFAVDFPDSKKWRLMDSKFLEVLVPGRNIDAYLTIVALSFKRVVTVLAPEGYGKSAVLSGFVCKYLNERRMFDDGCVVLDLAGCNLVSQVQRKLNRLVRRPSQANASANGMARKATADLDHAEEDEEELQLTISELAKRRCVLILDHVDQVLDESFDELRLFLGHLLDRTKGVRIVIATRSNKAVSIPGHEDVVHSLAPLSFLDSARLFLKCCPHYHNDVHASRPRLGLPHPEQFELGLSRHPICAEMNGVAKTVVQTASVITYEQWMEMVEEVTEALMCPPFSSDAAYLNSPSATTAVTTVLFGGSDAHRA